MPLPVSYMGTKRQLAASVAEIVARSEPGPFLDVFSGMCAIATAVAPARQIWTNDLQHFAHSVSLAHFRSRRKPPSRFDAAAWVSKAYSAHTNGHFAIASDRVQEEEAALHAEDAVRLNEVYRSWQDRSALATWEQAEGRDAHLFRDTFSGAFFGISQSIEIDALRYAIDLAKTQKVIDCDTHRWLVLALCVALSKCSASTGHFAQPLTAKPENIRRFAAQRRRSIRDAWLGAVEQLKPVGTSTWRRSNRAFRGEALDRLTGLAGETERPAVVYADPPYTNDQYSRYYHVYDTLIRYDYPDAAGRGLYRPDREVSSFSLASKVGASIVDLVERCAVLGSDLVLSYPKAGLLSNSRDKIPEIIRRAYGHDPEVLEIDHHHSTMGASKGNGKQAVVEVIYRGFH